MNEWISELNVWVYGIVSALAGGVIILIRKVLTNERQIDLLKAEIAMRVSSREKIDEDIKDQLKEIREDVKSLMLK